MSSNSVQGDWDLDTVWRPLTQHALRQRPLVVVSGKGCTVTDSEGKEYLDAMAGHLVRQRRLRPGAHRQGRGRADAAPALHAAHPPLAARPGAGRAARRSPARQPQPRAVRSTRGSEAVEAALRIARQAQRQLHPSENRVKIIARYRGYHGWTLGSLGATGQLGRKERVEPLLARLRPRLARPTPSASSPA